MYKVLVTTACSQTATSGDGKKSRAISLPGEVAPPISTSTAIATLVVEFASREAAEVAVEIINKPGRFPSQVFQRADLLWKESG